MRGSKGGPPEVVRKGRFVIVETKSGKLVAAAGQKARIETLRQQRTERVKEALSTASSHSSLFKSAG